MQVTDEWIKRWQNDYALFARDLLRVKNKAGKIVPFAFNEAQMYIHKNLEQQISETGKVRAIILKGRQQGASTYVSGRYFHKVVLNPGKRAFILTHEQAATDNLFDMTQRYLENYPPALRPALGASNTKELLFDLLDSGYKVATAGNKGAGRSATAQLLHGSEVAYWPSAQEHLSGIMQIIPMEPGTEIILESTANGIGNVFHDLWNSGAWKQIFVPWFWQHEYRIYDESIQLSEDDREYGQIYGLDDHQLAWRRHKISEMADEKLFMREYPATPAEAFSVSDDQSLIDGRFVIKARKSEASASGAKILGVDPARFGNDRTVIMIRQGRCAEVVNSTKNKDNMEVAGMVLAAIKKYSPKAVFIDMGGLGVGVLDRLRELGFGNIVHGVNFGGKPIDKTKYYNKRAEMWGLMKEWLYDQPVQIPDDDDLEIDLCGLHYSYDSMSRLKLESKEDAKKRGIKSPDIGDALALTFAMPVREDAQFINNDSVWKTTVPGMY